MGNIISDKSIGNSISISNSWTDVLLCTLLLSGSQTARTEWEKKTMIWLAEHDQNYIGSGIVGFDLSSIGWTKQNFAHEKKFLLKVIEKAVTEKIWEKLSFKADANTLTGFLNQLRVLIS